MQQHYFVSTPATLPIDLVEGMGIVVMTMTERERKRWILRRESQRAQHVFGQIDKGANQNQRVHGGAALDSRAQGLVWPSIDWERPSLLRRGTTSCVRRDESRLIGGCAASAPTLERATLKSKASQ